jgi:hypothetical protein
MLRSCVWLTLIVMTALLVVGGVVGATRGLDGILAAAVAAGLCWIGSTAALLIAVYYSRSNRAVQGHLLGMFLRLGIPLVAGIILQEQAGWLAQAGVFGQIVVFYLIALVAETLLSLPFVSHPKRITPAR